MSGTGLFPDEVCLSQKPTSLLSRARATAVACLSPEPGEFICSERHPLRLAQSRTAFSPFPKTQSGGSRQELEGSRDPS